MERTLSTPCAAIDPPNFSEPTETVTHAWPHHNYARLGEGGGRKKHTAELSLESVVERPTPVLEASTSTTNCRPSSGWCRMGADMNRSLRVSKT